MSPWIERAWLLLLCIPWSACTTPPLRCEAGETVGCSCGGDTSGTQICDGEGRYGACVCSAIPRCVPGSLFSCACEDGASGAQACDGAGMFGACTCGVDAPTCIPGAAAACRCIDGSEGAQTCTDAGTFAACVCAPPLPERCVPGLLRDCTCAPGVASTQECTREGIYSPCACGYLEAGMNDASDASRALPSCNPYYGETCGCPEPTLPSAPSLVPEARTLWNEVGPLVDVFVREEGIFIVTAAGVRVVSREGTELRRWDAPRPLTAAAADLEHLVVADAAGFVSLDVSLAPGAPVFTPFPCNSMALVSCARLLCTTGEAVLSYDLSTGALMARTAFAGGGSLVRVPGVDAALLMAPSWRQFLRFDPDGTVVPTGMSSLDAASIAFVGHPATHALLAQGPLMRLADCMFERPYESRPLCFARDGTLGTTAPTERVLAVATSVGSFIDMLVSTSDASGLVCRSGCSVQRVDVEHRRIVSRAPLTLAPVRNPTFVFRDDPWAGAVVLATPSTCDASGFRCSTVAVAVALYE